MHFDYCNVISVYKIEKNGTFFGYFRCLMEYYVALKTLFLIKNTILLKKPSLQKNENLSFFGVSADRFERFSPKI